METKEILAGCQLMQEGKPLTAEPVAGTVAVRPIAGGPFVQANGVDLVNALSAAYPKCQFLFLSNPAKKAKSGGDNGGSDEKNAKK